MIIEIYKTTNEDKKLYRICNTFNANIDFELKTAFICCGDLENFESVDFFSYEYYPLDKRIQLYIKG